MSRCTSTAGTPKTVRKRVLHEPLTMLPETADAAATVQAEGAIGVAGVPGASKKSRSRAHWEKVRAKGNADPAKKLVRNQKRRASRKEKKRIRLMTEECATTGDASTMDVASSVLLEAKGTGPSPPSASTEAPLPSGTVAAEVWLSTVIEDSGKSALEFFQGLEADHTDLVAKYSAKVKEASDLARQNGVLQYRGREVLMTRDAEIARCREAYEQKCVENDAETRKSLLRHKLELNSSLAMLKKHDSVCSKLNFAEQQLETALKELDQLACSSVPKSDYDDVVAKLALRDSRVAALESQLAARGLVATAASASALPEAENGSSSMHVDGSRGTPPLVSSDTPPATPVDLTELSTTELPSYRDENNNSSTLTDETVIAKVVKQELINAHLHSFVSDSCNCWCSLFF